ncbi:MAG TPA: DNA-formamidopyrimidine glycosylase family protein [Fimbriimonadaceae bacterium]|nr:DNA-formamidopyrimidine glycosylase family protein [Fimbriimonadaceae bacterium]
MPELPEVETVRRIMERVLKGQKISEVEIVPDDIVQGSTPPEAFVEALKGSAVTDVGRKGKYWWIELDGKTYLFGHLGMAGWIRELGAPTVRLREHGNAPLDDGDGRPRFLKMMLTAEDGRRIAFTDQRRLARMWLGADPAKDSRIKQLGFDCYDELPNAKKLGEILAKRSAPIKAVLLDQTVFAGVGNWIADETLYHARIAPKRSADSLKPAEVARLRDALERVIHTAVEAGADSDKYPADWLFSSRWGGKKGRTEIDGKKIVREPVGGRTTAWVPSVQK